MKKKIIAFDLDETLCKREKNLNSIKRYKYCKPIRKNINYLKRLYKDGYYIKIYTARGINTFRGDVGKIYSELFEFTKNQLKKWKIPYHELVMGKQEYNLLIDDKVLNISDIKKYTDIIERLK
jgi:FMN phosphatase YigB (HAD superfamily)